MLQLFDASIPRRWMGSMMIDESLLSSFGIRHVEIRRIILKIFFGTKQRFKKIKMFPVFGKLWQIVGIES